MNPKNGLKIKPWKIKYRETEDELRGLLKVFFLLFFFFPSFSHFFF